MDQKFDISAFTHVGTVRETNQDSILVNGHLLNKGEVHLSGQEGCFCFVADGVGGAKGGDFASWFVLENIAAGQDKLLMDAEQTLTAINYRLIDETIHDINLQGCCTTLSGLLITNNHFKIIHAGDSEIWLLRNDMFFKITRDHVLDETVKNSPITSYFGGLDNYLRLDFETSIHDSLADDLFLICSDGLFKSINLKIVKSILKSQKDLAPKAEKILENCLLVGAEDNISVILIQQTNKVNVMAQDDDNKTTTYGDADLNKTEAYGNPENQKTTLYNSGRDVTVAYNDQNNSETKSGTHGLGVGDKIILRNTEYTVTGIISEGTGEAVIYKIEDSGRKAFALKLYFEFFYSREEPNFETLKRIKDITDPDILKLYDFGVGADKYQGRYCYEISDFAEGGDLFAVANFKGKYTKDFIERNIVPEILNGIKKLHEFKIYHCDLKPGNILFKDKNQTDLLIGDYGSAKAYDLETEKEIRKSTSVKGTDAYLPPEQARGIISEKNDYYSFGVILLHLLYPEQISDENNVRQIHRKKFEKIVERQYNSQPLIDFNASYERLNNLIEGLTLINHVNRFGKKEVEKWLQGENVEVKYKTGESSGVLPVKLGYATIKNGKDLIQVLETRDSWWEDIFEDVDTYFALKAWIASYHDVSSRKIFDEMIHFYKPLGKEYVKEATIRYFEPGKDIQIDMTLFNFHTAGMVNEEVSKYIEKLDEIWKISTFEKIRFHLFQLEFSLKQFASAIQGEKSILVNSLIEKISSAFGCVPDDFVSRKAQITEMFSPKNEQESYIKLLNLFYLFNKGRTYRDTKNRSFDNIQDIAFAYSLDEELFHDKFCKLELTVYLSAKKITDVKLNTFADFLFSIFRDNFKSDIHVEQVSFQNNKAIVSYNFNKSLSEFLASKGITKTVLVRGSHREIEIPTKLRPSGHSIYNNFISEIFKVHSITEQSFEKNSLDTARTVIGNFTKTFKRRQSKSANVFGLGLTVYFLPIIVALLGAYVLVFQSRIIFDFLHINVGAFDFAESFPVSLRTSFLMGYVYVALIVSLIPAIIFFLGNSKDGNLHENFDNGFYKPHNFAWGIIIYALLTVVFSFILGIVIWVVVGIASIFGDFKTDPTVDTIMNFIFILSAFLPLGFAFIPFGKFYQRSFSESGIVKYNIRKKILVFTILLGSIIFVSLNSASITPFKFNIFSSGKSIRENQTVERKFYTVISDAANIRTLPTTDSPIIGTIMKNDSIEFVGIADNNWVQVKYMEQEAYIHSSLLKEKQ